MATKVLMEALSPTMEEGRVLQWLKREGDAISAGDVLAEVETDKAVMELQARGAGVLRAILAGAGTTVDVGATVAVIAAPDEDIAALLGPAPAPAATPPTPPAPVEAHVPPAGAPPTATAEQGRVKASPLARRLAQERGLDLAAVQGTGPGGRITRRDVDRAEAAPSVVPPPAPAGGFEDIPLTQVRKAIAKRLVTSLGPIPQFFLTMQVDMERTAELRAELNAADDGPRISYNDVIVKAIAMALRQHPSCNAWWMDDRVRVFHEVHLSMAVAIADGLITPVIRHADRKSLRELAAESRTLAERARTRKLTPEEYTGGTFSVSNLGMFDIDQFTAVINPPEAGIVAVGSIVEKPVAVDGELRVRKRLRLTMSCDHRVIDGATGARFLQTVKQMLENPLAMVW